MQDKSSIDITVILCTMNRSQSLVRALDSLAAQRLPESLRWEVLVVDNNSTDETGRVVKDFSSRYPARFRYLLEPRAGKSNALNAGIQEAEGRVLAFTDDDIVAVPDWLKELTCPLLEHEFAGAGGRTLPARDFTPPVWLAVNDRYALAPLALFDRGPEPCELNEAPFGNNMAYRREVFDRHGRFRLDIGPQPGTGNPQKGEDSEFGQRVLASGERLNYSPSAVVYHDVPQSRVTQEYFLAWWYDKARSDLRISGGSSGVKWIFLGVPLVHLRRLFRWILQWCISPTSARRFYCRIQMWSLLGTIRECYRLAGQQS